MLWWLAIYFGLDGELLIEPKRGTSDGLAEGWLRLAISENGILAGATITRGISTAQTVIGTVLCQRGLESGFDTYFGTPFS